jgi:hypothetical protein
MECKVVKPSVSKCGAFVDYFGNPIKVGNIVVFKSCDYNNDKEFYKARVKALVTQNGEYNWDFCVLEDVQAPHNLGKVKNGSKKQCHLCIIVENSKVE